jgi:hypothetical protein
VAPLALAEQVYEAVLRPSLVVPPADESAYGMATLIVSDNGLRAGLTVNFAGLETAQTAAFLMAAPEGLNGPELFALPLGTPFATMIDMTPALTAALTANQLAIQINCVDHPNGVLRGNFSFTIVATEEMTWSSVKALFE